jgi:hypothetical protein
MGEVFFLLTHPLMGNPFSQHISSVIEEFIYSNVQISRTSPHLHISISFPIYRFQIYCNVMFSVKLPIILSLIYKT